MAEWRRHGLLGLTLNLQGGSPQGYSQDQPWHNSAFSPDGSLRPEYMRRLERILDRADTLGMVAIVGLFYFGQDQRLENDDAVRRAVREATLWLSRKEYRHVLIEIANECDNAKYDQPLIKPERVVELIELARSVTRNGWRYPVSVSFNGGRIPSPAVVANADFLLLHGNGVADPARIPGMVAQARKVDGYRPMPILFNEDDHFDFDKPTNNFVGGGRRRRIVGLLRLPHEGGRLRRGLSERPGELGHQLAKEARLFLPRARDDRSLTADGAAATQVTLQLLAERDIAKSKVADRNDVRRARLAHRVGISSGPVVFRG